VTRRERTLVLCFAPFLTFTLDCDLHCAPLQQTTQFNKQFIPKVALKSPSGNLKRGEQRSEKRKISQIIITRGMFEKKEQTLQQPTMPPAAVLSIVVWEQTGKRPEQTTCGLKGSLHVEHAYVTLTMTFLHALP
jgi:hypothetical protein